MIDETPRRAGYQSVRQAVALGGGGSGSKARQFKITSVAFSDYLICHSYDGGTEGQEAIYVAKPWFLRGTDTWGSITRLNISYEYQSPASRTATKQISPAISEVRQQDIVPTYVVGDIIVAEECNTGVTVQIDAETTQAVTWIDINTDGRCWAE